MTHLVFGLGLVLSVQELLHAVCVQHVLFHRIGNRRFLLFLVLRRTCHKFGKPRCHVG